MLVAVARVTAGTSWPVHAETVRSMLTSLAADIYAYKLCKKIAPCQLHLRDSLAVMIPGSHPGGPGSTPGHGIFVPSLDDLHP